MLKYPTRHTRLAVHTMGSEGEAGADCSLLTYHLRIDNVSIEFLFVRERQTEDRDGVVDTLLQADHPDLGDEQGDLP